MIILIDNQNSHNYILIIRPLFITSTPPQLLIYRFVRLIMLPGVPLVSQKLGIYLYIKLKKKKKNRRLKLRIQCMY